MITPSNALTPSWDPKWDRMIFFSIVLIILIIAVLGSCKLPHITQQTAIKDSISYMERVVWRDSIVTLPGDTIEFQVPCDNDTVFILKGNSSRALVQVKNHEVHVENDCDEQSRIITGLISEINTIKSHSNDSSKTVTLPVKFIPAWYKFTNKAFYVESLLLLLFLGYTFRKPIALILGA